MTVRKQVAAMALVALMVAGCAKSPPVIVPSAPPPPVAAPPSAGSSAHFYIVTSGTASALERLPKGTARRLADPICLRAEETLTLVSRTSGRKVTYVGPGCNKTAESPEATQTSATTIGALAAPPERGSAMRQ